MEKIDKSRNVDGQIDCIINFMSHDLQRYTCFSDYLRMNNILLGAFCKTTWNYKPQILKYMVAWSITYIRNIIR